MAGHLVYQQTSPQRYGAAHTGPTQRKAEKGRKKREEKNGQSWGEASRALSHALSNYVLTSDVFLAHPVLPGLRTMTVNVWSFHSLRIFPQTAPYLLAG